MTTMEKQHDRNGNPTVAVVHFAGGYDDFGNKKRGWNSPACQASGIIRARILYDEDGNFLRSERGNAGPFTQK